MILFGRNGYWSNADFVDCLDQSFNRDRLQQIVDCIKVEGINGKFFMRSCKNYFRGIAKCAIKFMPHQFRHADVKKHKINLLMFQYFHCLKGIVTGGGNFQPWYNADMIYQHINCQWLIINYQTMNFHKLNAGSATVFI